MACRRCHRRGGLLGRRSADLVQLLAQRRLGSGPGRKRQWCKCSHYR